MVGWTASLDLSHSVENKKISIQLNKDRYKFYINMMTFFRTVYFEVIPLKNFFSYLYKYACYL